MKEELWTKILINGDQETGTDSDIKKGLASWTRGRQDIVRSTASLNGRFLTLACPPRKNLTASWGQLDHFISSFQTGTSTRVGRELFCSTLNYSRVKVEQFPGSKIVITLNDNDGEIIPSNTKNVRTAISTDGSIKLMFEAND